MVEAWGGGGKETGGTRARLGAIARALGELIVPPACFACRARLASSDTICATCWRDVAFIKAPLCDRLGLPLPFGGAGPLVSAAAVANPPVWNRARAVALYTGGGVMANLIGGMKYGDRQDARRLFGHWLRQAGAELLDEAELIVPVPLTRWRLMRRQFNQAAMLAQELSRASGVAWDPWVLAKLRGTTPQVQLSGTARRDNLRGAFRVPARQAGKVAGKRVLLLDDVITTGATAEACTRALLAAGAGRVDVLALAMAPAPTNASP